MLLRVENPSFIVAAIACHPQKSWKAKDDGGFGSRRPPADFILDYLEIVFGDGVKKREEHEGLPMKRH
jgi:hypothetical protein